MKKFKNKKKKHLLIGGILFGCIASVLCIYIFISTHLLIAANFADNVMRPVIGNQATIIIEAFFFRVTDRANLFKYSFIKPKLGTLTSDSVGEHTIVNVQKNTFTLQTISPLSNLPALVDEGVWKPIKNATSGPILAETLYRPDPKRDYAIAYLVKMNMDHLSISAVAGTREPGESAHPGPGKIPGEAQARNMLVAAFNGGFQLKDGHYGMIVDNEEYLPLQKNLATLMIYKHAKPAIINYDGQHIGTDVIAIRQNGPMLLQNSIDVSGSQEWTMQKWGLTTTNSMYTWRSGIGVTSTGDLIYAAGPSLVPETLAAALKAAGAVNGMQLDINPVWVRFVVFTPLGNGRYNYQALTTTMQNGGYSYLYGYQKDFFYLQEK